MRWRTGRKSSNIEDRRSIRIPRKAAGGGIGIIVIALDRHVLRCRSYHTLKSAGPDHQQCDPTYTSSKPISPAENQLADFVSVVLADTEDTWHVLFNKMGKTYREPTSGSIFRCGGIRLRLCAGCHGTVLLPRRSKGLYRPELLSGFKKPTSGAGRFCPGLCDCP